MHQPPFHRKILPWVFVFLFFALVPVVIFYTSGYRWDSKKGKVERNGTVIIDSTPTDAEIWIDGRKIDKQTPTTIQDMAPGIHRFLIQKNGYTSWEKSLDVHAERVTFANRIRLWKISEPILIASSTLSSISITPTETTLFQLEHGTTTVAVLRDLQTNETERRVFPKPIAAPVRISWTPSGSFAHIEPLSSSAERSWLVDAQRATKPLELPIGTYHFTSSRLVGHSDTAHLEIRLSDMSVSRTEFAQQVWDTSNGNELRVSSGTSNLIYVKDRSSETGAVLPSGAWTFWSTTNATTIFRDGNRWMALQENASPPQYHLASGDVPRAFTESGVTKLLLVNGPELWVWNPLEEPELVYRLSEDIIDAAWQSEGDDIVYATKTGVYALNLDPRDGHLITRISEFDRISGFSSTEDRLYVSGTKNDLTGVWSLNIQ